MTDTATSPDHATTSDWSELKIGAWRQANVIFALIFKELKTRLENESYGGIVWIMFDPIQRVIVLAALWYLIGRPSIDGVHVALFLAVSMIPFTFIRMCMSNIPGAVWSNRSFYNFQQVKPIDALIARFALNVAITAVGLIVMLFGLAWFFGLFIKVDHLLELLSLLVLALVMGFAIALFIATYGTMYDIVSRLLSVASRPLLFVSAVIHPVNDVPASARHLLSWNPLVHLNELIRYYALGMKPFPEAGIMWPLGFTLVVLFLAVTSYYANRQRLIQKR